MLTNPASSVRWTTADLELFAGDRTKRYEIIDGELFVTKAPSWKHQTTCINIGIELKLWIDNGGFGEVAVGPGIIFSDADNVIPDVVWVSSDRLEILLDDAGHLTGAPELVVEILSPGDKNERRDRESKLKLYSVQGVREYWIINPQNSIVEVYRRDNGALKLAATLYSQDELTSPLLPGFNCVVSKFF